MDRESYGCRLCLDSFVECFTTIDNPQLKGQMEKVFSFAIDPKQGYCSGVCQSCSYAISEFYQYSEKVRQNQEILNGNVKIYDPTVDVNITLETCVKIERLSDSVFPETTKDACKPKDEVLAQDVSNSSDVKPYGPPPKQSQTQQKSKLIDLEAVEPTKVSKQTTLKTQKERNEEDQLFNKHIRMICNLCGALAASYTELFSHFRVEHKQRNGYVVCCNKKLFKRCAIREHIDFHVNPDVFRCEVCGKKYKNKDILNVHMTNQHSGKNRTLVCDTCGKEFRNKQNLHRHMNQHMANGIQRYKCGICQRWLKHESSLRHHMITVHTDSDREFQCEICLRKYPHSKALQLHKSQTHSQPKHECEVCGKKLKHLAALKEHRTIHTGKALYTCEFCGIPINQRSSMSKHIKQQHPVEWAQKKLLAYDVSD